MGWILAVIALAAALMVVLAVKATVLLARALLAVGVAMFRAVLALLR